MLAWGMTEITPIATVMAMKSHLDCLPEEQRLDVMTRHGIPVAGVDLRIVDAEGHELPWDGSTMGELQVRGPWVTGGCVQEPGPDKRFLDGWFRTGSGARIHSEGRR